MHAAPHVAATAKLLADDDEYVRAEALKVLPSRYGDSENLQLIARIFATLACWRFPLTWNVRMLRPGPWYR